jgi:hypothetical protein
MVKNAFVPYANFIFILISFPSKSWGGGNLARMGERRGAYRALMGKLEGRRPPGRPRGKWEDNIKMDLRDVGWRA